MPKKKQRSKQVSNGVVGKPMRAKTSVGMTRLLNQLEAWEKGKNVVLTVQNKRGVYEKVNAKDHWGPPPMERRKMQNEN